MPTPPDQHTPPTHGPLAGRTIVLGVAGSIAAYKAADLTSRLRDQGAEVFVVMTRAATEFIAPLTLQTLSRHPVAHDLWEEGKGWQPGHIDLADQANLLLIAPATANIIAECAQGLALDLLSSIYLATPAPVWFAPAMNGKMWAHPATRENVSRLEGRGHRFIEPSEGLLACGYEGQGKLAAVETIVGEVVRAFQGKG